MKRAGWGALAVASLAGAVGLAAVRGFPPRESGNPLAEALAGRRLVEPRLTGGFGYAPCQRETREGRRLPVVRCSEAPTSQETDLQRVLKELETGPERHAWSIARLLMGGDRQAAEAVKALGDEARRAPGDGRVLSDLAAAYTVEAFRTDEPEDLVRALDAAAKALEADPALPEARFNYALALENLQLKHLAAGAWERYLDLDPASSWAEEARERLRGQKARTAAAQWKAALARDDATELHKLVPLAPQEAREHALEALLGRWGDGVLAKDPKGSEKALLEAALLGKALEVQGGDRSVAAAVEAIREVPVGDSRVTALARGHQAFREGMKAFRALKTNQATQRFEEAYADLSQGGSATSLWALCGLARCQGYDGRYAEARKAYEALLGRADGRAYPSLAAWAHWGLAWVASRQGRYGEALSRSLLARDGYQRAGERENLGFTRFLLGQSLVLLGQKRTAWREIPQALEMLSADDLPSFRRHVVLLGASTDAFEDGLPRAALLFRQECSWAAEQSGDPIRRAESRWALGEALAALGRSDEALASLSEAAGIVRVLPSDSPVQKLRADILWAEGMVRSRSDPKRSLSLLTESLEAYQRLNAPLSVAYTAVARARVERALGHREAALQDVRSAQRILEDPASGVSEDDLRLSFSESVQDVYDEMIHLEWEDQSRPLAALETLERARAFQNQSKADLRLDLRRLPNDRAVLQYALLEDRLLIWMIFGGRVSAYERGIRRDQVEDLVRRFLEALEGAREGEALGLSSRLHDLLLPRALDGLPPEVSLSIIPDRVLNKIPFAGLRDPRTGRFLIETRTLSLSPGLTREARAVRSPAGPIASALLVGNPTFDRRMFSLLKDLGGVEGEIEQARKAFPRSLVLAGNEATKPRFLAELERFEAVVFAGHAVINASLPSRSYLVLAPSGAAEPGLLTAGELEQADLSRLRLVVLSACESAGPRSARTAGISGLAKPFLDGGLPSVIATLWPVEDRGTGVLTDLYSALGAGEAPAVALRRAQIRALRSSRRLGSWSAIAIIESRSLQGGS